MTVTARRRRRTANVRKVVGDMFEAESVARQLQRTGLSFLLHVSLEV